MADTVDDVVLTGSDWQNGYTLSGIAGGTSVQVQNKTSGRVFVYFKATKPTSDFGNGLVLDSYDTYTVPASVSGLWLFGDGPVHIRNPA